MHIEKVTIENFRCFEHLEVKLNPDVNVFVGNNGSGKSALLDAIAASLFPYLSNVQNFSEHKQLQQSIVKVKDFRVTKKEQIAGDISFNFSSTSFPDVKSKYEFRESTSGNTIVNPIIPNSTEFHQAIRREHDYFNRSSRPQIPLAVYYQGHRSFAGIEDIKTLQNRSFDRFSSLNRSLDAAANFNDLAQWFFVRELQELRAAKQSGDINLELEDLKAVRSAVAFLIHPSSSVYFSQETSKAELKVKWTDEIGNEKDLLVNQLSAGYRNMLALVMDFARRLVQANPNIEKPLSAEAVLLIDEIDLHLHPVWQQSVIPDLRRVFPNTQILVTTHSPEVVTTVEQHQVFLLENYQVKDCPSPTRGMKSSEVVRYVLGLNDLRPETEEKQTLIQLFEAIDNGDIAAAKRLREDLKNWESFDSDLTRADMQIRRMERRTSA